MRDSHAAAACLALVAAMLATSATAWADGSRPGRLPAGVAPVHYELRIEPDAAALTFAGHAAIDVDVLQPTRQITLNALDIDISSARLDGGEPDRIEFDAQAHTVGLSFDTPVAPGRRRLEFEYTGRISTTPTGLFAVDYETEDGPRRMLTTQFEVADGRRFAPMWDEPAAKATFALEVVVPATQTAISNMPVASEQVEGDRRRIRFAPSPRMSSYLLHLSAGELDRISRRVGDVEVGVVTRRGAAESGRYALDAAAELLPWFDDYFGTPYPLPKLDMIAVPGASQFFGAMENWGAIMYFEPYLLVDPKLSSEADRQSVFAFVAHEVAHQWFGNLVTMDWWDDLWLNEGFATWMEEKAAAVLHPEFESALAVVNGSRETALRRDAGAATHPVVQPVPSVDAASQAFDEIAYSKGSAVVRMLEDALGESGFRAGIRRYMARYAYGNAATDQLWAELAAATGRPVVDIAHDFTLQPGVPLVSVQTAPCEDGRTTLTLSQSRFETGAKDPQAVRWRIPVRIAALDAAPQDVLLDKVEPLTVTVDSCGPVIVNAGQAGYMRVRYGDDELRALQAAFPRIAEIDRLGMLNDAWALGEAGEIPVTHYLSLSSAVAPDDHPLIQVQLARTFLRIDRVFEGSAQREAWRAHARGRLQPVYALIGWEAVPDEAETVALLREALIRALGSVDDPAVIGEARARFARAPKSPEAMPAAIRSSILHVVALTADAATWNEILARAKAALEPIERQRLFDALGLARDPALARRALDLALSSEVPVAYATSLMSAVASQHPELAFEFAVANERAVLERVESASRWSFIVGLAAGSADPAMVERVHAFVERSVPPDARQAAQQAQAEIRFRSDVRAKQLPTLEAWVQSSAARVAARRE